MRNTTHIPTLENQEAFQLQTHNVYPKIKSKAYPNINNNAYSNIRNTTDNSTPETQYIKASYILT